MNLHVIYNLVLMINSFWTANGNKGGGGQYPSHHTKRNKMTKKKETQLAANILKLEQNLKEDNLQELEKLDQN